MDNIAPYAVWIALGACALAVLACVLTVRAYFWTSREVRKLRSIHSMQGELVEMHDALTKVTLVVKRIASRQTMQDRRAVQPELDLQSVTDKAELRRRIGLVPGKPAPHK